MAKIMKKERGIYEKTVGSGVWYIRYADVDGRIRKEMAGTPAVAKKLLGIRKHEAQVERKLPHLSRRSVLFSELAADALEYSKQHKASYRDDVIKMKIIQDWVGQKAAEKITPLEMERWLHDRSKTPATFNRYKALLSLTFKLGERNGKVTVNPARMIRQRREDNARLRYMEWSEEGKLREYIMSKWPYNWSAVEVALNTGMRFSEQFNLRWTDIDFDRKVVTLDKTKNGNSRHIPLNERAMSALLTAQSLSNGQPWVFLNHVGTRMADIRFWFNQAIEAVKIEGVTWHTLRHTFASRLIMAGVDIRTVQELLGHKTLTMTLRYAHLSPAHNLAAVERLCNTQNETGPETAPYSDLVFKDDSILVQ